MKEALNRLESAGWTNKDVTSQQVKAMITIVAKEKQTLMPKKKNQGYSENKIKKEMMPETFHIAASDSEGSAGSFDVVTVKKERVERKSRKERLKEEDGGATGSEKKD